MPAVILHVEDDLMLGALVTLTLEDLGFHGKTITAQSVGAGERILDDAARAGQTFDLILSDMNLPDGSGLDLVRYVRGSVAWRSTPMLILSGDLDPKKVSQAYALGANAYVSKSPPGRTLDEVIAALYEHWMMDVVQVRPSTATSDGALARSIKVRLHHAQLYQRLAEKFADNRSEAAFWLSRALGESNLINVLGFVQRQIAGHESALATEALADVAPIQRANELAISTLELDLDHDAMSRDDVYRRVLELFSIPAIEVVARSIGQLFPVIPVAIATLRHFLLGSIQDLSAWIYLHASAPDVRENAMKLRDAAMILVSGNDEPPRDAA